MDATRFDFDQAAFDALPPDLRRKALQAMAEMAGGHKTNPLWRFDPLNPNGIGTPHWPQHRWLSAWRTPEGRNVKFRLMAGGNRSGKTTAGDVADIIDACDREAIPPHLQAYKRHDPPNHGYLVAVSQRAVEKIHLKKFMEWCPKDQLVGNSLSKAFNKEYSTLHFKNGSTISFLTQNMEPEVFQGTDLDWIHFDEEPLYDHGLELFTESMQRLVDRNGDVRLTFTPLNGMTWVYDKLWLPWAMQQPDKEASNFGYATTEFNGFQFPVYCEMVEQDDNPVIDDEGKAAALAMARNDEERAARQSGRFVSFAGKIFDGFSRSKHIVPDDAVFDRYRSGHLQAFLGGLDPGFRHMAGVIWVGLDDDGVWVGPELGLAQTVIADVAKEIQVTQLTHDLRSTIFLADPAIAKIDAQTGKTDQQAYAEAGILTRPANNSVRHGINAIRSLLGADRIHVAASCEVLIEQFNRYRWKSTGRSEDDAPDRPVKRDDHLLDALRYAIMALPIPEVVGAADERTKLERLLSQDLARAKLAGSGEQETHGSAIGAGMWD